MGWSLPSEPPFGFFSSGTWKAVVHLLAVVHMCHMHGSLILLRAQPPGHSPLQPGSPSLYFTEQRIAQVNALCSRVPLFVQKKKGYLSKRSSTGSMPFCAASLSFAFELEYKHPP
jgi:hypothetical protein